MRHEPERRVRVGKRVAMTSKTERTESHTLRWQFLPLFCSGALVLLPEPVSSLLISKQLSGSPTEHFVFVTFSSDPAVRNGVQGDAEITVQDEWLVPLSF